MQFESNAWIRQIVIAKYIKNNLQRFLNKVERKSLVASEIWYAWGWLNRKGAYLKFWLREEGLNRGRGIKRAFTVSSNEIVWINLHFFEQWFVGDLLHKTIFLLSDIWGSAQFSFLVYEFTGFWYFHISFFFVIFMLPTCISLLLLLDL